MSDIGYSLKTWTCGVCGASYTSDIGRCPSCDGGSLPRGGLLAGAPQYVPFWHGKRSDLPVVRDKFERTVARDETFSKGDKSALRTLAESDQLPDEQED